MKNLFKLHHLLLVMCLVSISACDDDDDAPENEPMTIVDIAASDPQFSTLVAALTKANLVSVLDGDGPFTVFAPTNAAFTALLSDLGASGLDDISAEA